MNDIVPEEEYLALMFADSSDSESDNFEDLGDDSPCEDETADRPNISFGDRGNSTQRSVESVENIEWVGYNSADIRCNAHQFSGQPGLNVHINNHNDPYELFKLFVTDELVDMIVNQTNLYAEQFMSNRQLTQFSRFQAWKPTDQNEIFLLLGIYILLGLIWKPKIDSYFTSKPIFSTPGFPYLLSHKRLKLLNRFLHFTNNLYPPSENKKFHKIKPVFDYINRKFSEVYTPVREVSVDESLLLWKGRLSFQQYIRIKKARFGIKTYVLSEAKSGYICKLIVYVGKETELIQNPQYGHATNVVLTVLNELLDKGYCVYTDNYYCSPELALSLHQRKTDIVGTVRSNRKGLPKEFVKQKLDKNEITAACEKFGKMMFVKWVDKRDVLFLTTVHQLEYTEVKRRGKSVLVPGLVQDYNLFMGGVDRVDQMLSAYPLERKRQKVWYKKEFRHLINMCIYNAHAIHVKCNGNMTSLEFREALVEKIISQHFDEERQVKKGRPSLESDPLRLHQRHFPEYVPATEKKENATRRCAVCSKNKIRRETRYQCTECNVGLCAAPCFKIFHTKKNY